MGEGENAGFSNMIPLFKKTLKMTLHKQRKSPTAALVTFRPIPYLHQIPITRGLPNELQKLAKLSKASAVCISIGSLDHVIGRVHYRK